MSYEEQLSAAKFMAERDQARQELERAKEEIGKLHSDAIARFVVEQSMDNIEREIKLGVNSIAELLEIGGEIQELPIAEVCPRIVAEMEKRLMPEGYEWSDGFSGAVDFFEAMHDLLYTIDGEEHTGPEMVRDVMARLMPESMEWILEVWPKWSNGEYCKFGDWWTADKYGHYEPKQLRRLVFYTPEQLREWEQDEGDNFGYEWDFMRPSDTTYRPDKAEPPAPKAIAADNEPLEVGQTVWGIGRSRHEFEVLDPNDTNPEVGERFSVKCLDRDDDEVCWCDPRLLTHAKPEPPDSWERVEEDVTLSVEKYRERYGIKKHDGMTWPQLVREDLVSRCRALAERGE